MISFDGFRWDYPELHGAPALLALARDGVRAKSLMPSFPSKTYPNHYTLVTGLRPEHHGIVANTNVGSGVEGGVLARRPIRRRGRPMVGGRADLGDRRAPRTGDGVVVLARFGGGDRRGRRGRGVRPTFWGRYDDTVPDEKRVDEVLGWLDLPAEKRPRLITLYFDEPDGAGHAFGPASPEAASAVAHVDKMLARLRAGVAARGLDDAVDWIVVSDHGMSATDPERSIVLADLVDLAGVAIADLSAFGLLRPRPGTEDALVRRLTGAHPHLHAARKGAVPERLHYRAHRRIPEVVVWADAGWTIYATAAARAKALADFPLGNHGYDPAERDMHGIFVAAGPSFRRGHHHPDARQRRRLPPPRPPPRPPRRRQRRQPGDHRRDARRAHAVESNSRRNRGRARARSSPLDGPHPAARRGPARCRAAHSPRRTGKRTSRSARPRRAGDRFPCGRSSQTARWGSRGPLEPKVHLLELAQVATAITALLLPALFAGMTTSEAEALMTLAQASDRLEEADRVGHPQRFCCSLQRMWSPA